MPPGPYGQPGVPPGPYVQYGYALEAPRQKRTSSIAIIAIAVVVAVLGLASIVAVLVTRNGGDDERSTTSSTTSASITTLVPAGVVTTVPPGGAIAVSTAGGAGYPGPEEALTAELPRGWVYRTATDSRREVVYWAGPPNSEWATTYVVKKTSDGLWDVTEARPFGAGSAAASGQPADEAASLVTTFITAVKEDRPMDAHALTIEPFANDPASAQYSNGELKDFRIDQVEPVEDGTFWVTATETWTYGDETWRYHVVPTEAGLRINDLTGA